MHCVVVAAGEMKYPPFWRATLAKAEMIICADGGWHHLKQLGVTPSRVIGDFDSVDREAIPPGIPTSPFPREKAYSDTELALTWVSNHHPGASITLLGAGGGRLDHQQANLALLLNYPQQLTIADGDVEVVAVNRSIAFTAAVGQTCTLLPVAASPCVVTTTGLTYNLTREQLRPGSHGLSNVTTATSVTIDCHQGSLFLFRIFEPPRS